LGKINFKEKVNLYERFVKVENVKKKEEILKILTGSKEVNYVVKKGDLGNTIAKKFAINLNVLKMENPDVNFDNLKIGETIKIKNKPVLTVVTQKLLIKREKIPPQILKISTNRLPKGTQEIREKGETGEKEKVILLTYENGKLANQELLKETILKKPTYRVIVKGVRE
jgi:LysM repeat protein